MMKCMSTSLKFSFEWPPRPFREGAGTMEGWGRRENNSVTQRETSRGDLKKKKKKSPSEKNAKKDKYSGGDFTRLFRKNAARTFF